MALSTPLLLPGCEDDPRRQAMRMLDDIQPYFDHAELEPEILRSEVVATGEFLAQPRQPDA
jgi:hypothetical protein